MAPVGSRSRAVALGGSETHKAGGRQPADHPRVRRPKRDACCLRRLRQNSLRTVSTWAKTEEAGWACKKQTESGLFLFPEARGS